MSNTDQAGEDFPLTRTIELGFEHDIVERDGGDVVVLRRDEDGNPIPRTYQIPSRITPAHIYAASVGKLGEDVEKELALGGPTARYALLGIAIGRDVVKQMASDPTITFVDFDRFVTETLIDLGLAEEFTVNPTGGPDGPHGK